MSVKRFLVEFAVIMLAYMLCVVISSAYVSSMSDGAAKSPWPCYQ